MKSGLANHKCVNIWQCVDSDRFVCNIKIIAKAMVDGNLFETNHACMKY